MRLPICEAMALSRPLLLALLGVALLGATVFAVQNARDKAADDPAPVAQQTADPAAPATSTPAQSVSVAPAELLRTGVTAESLESAAFRGALTFSSGGVRNVIKTSGAFELGGPKETPKVDFHLSVRANSMNLNAAGGFVTTGDRAWFTRGDTGYAVPQEAWSKLVEARQSGAAPAGVIQPQNITRPAKVKNALPSGAFGQFATGFVAGLGNRLGVSADDLRLGVPNTNAHVKAERAVADNRKVVIFFENPKGFDDKAVSRSVRTLDRRTKSVVVLTDDVRNADRYESMLEDLGVNQAPAIVVIGRSGKASLIEGYIDAELLVQVVADAR